MRPDIKIMFPVWQNCGQAMFDHQVEKCVHTLHSKTSSESSQQPGKTRVFHLDNVEPFRFAY